MMFKVGVDVLALFGRAGFFFFVFEMTIWSISTAIIQAWLGC